MTEELREKLIEVMDELYSWRDHTCAAENVKEPQLDCDIVARHQGDARRHARRAFYMLEGVLYQRKSD